MTNLTLLIKTQYNYYSENASMFNNDNVHLVVDEQPTTAYILAKLFPISFQINNMISKCDLGLF